MTRATYRFRNFHIKADDSPDAARWSPDRDIGHTADSLVGEMAADLALRGVAWEPFASTRRFLRSYGNLSLPYPGRTAELGTADLPPR